MAYLFDYVGDLNEILCFAGRKNCPEFNMSCAYMAKLVNIYSLRDIEKTLSMILFFTFMSLRNINEIDSIISIFHKFLSVM